MKIKTVLTYHFLLIRWGKNLKTDKHNLKGKGYLELYVEEDMLYKI